MEQAKRTRGAIDFLANPYVVLVDVLIATFFVMVLYIHFVRLQSADPKLRAIERSQKQLVAKIAEGFQGSILDEGQLGSAVWQQARDSGQTDLVIKQDASVIKLVLVGGEGERALFKPGTSVLTQRGYRVLTRLVEYLGESEDAYALLDRRNPILLNNITVEGHTASPASEGIKPRERTWEVAVQRALAVRYFLEKKGIGYDTAYNERHSLGEAEALRLFSPGRLTVVGRGHWQQLPGTSEADPINRRVQIELRFTQRGANEEAAG